jgi:hypothetical protein
MGSHETYSIENEWYTPSYIFKALHCTFDVDVAAAPDPSLAFVPALTFISSGSLSKAWEGFAWCNPPWSGRGNKQPWIDRMADHNNGLLLTPDRTSAPWWQTAAIKSDAVLFVFGKIQFHLGPGNLQNNKQPGVGTTIFAWGPKAITALLNAQENGLGTVLNKI